LTRKRSLYVLIFAIVILLLFFVFSNRPVNENNASDSWIGSYTFYEYLPPNQNMEYSIHIYEDEGLYAQIKIDGFHTLKRLKAKVWSNGNETMFFFMTIIQTKKVIALFPIHIMKAIFYLS